jgi:SSS family solute:Na+ symporter
MSTLSAASFVAATLLVAAITHFWVRRLEVSGSAVEEYFSGGRSLAWPVVAGSLMLTNLSTEQLIGLNGSVYGDGNLVAAAWELLAAAAMVVTALVFLPRYLSRGFSTTPGYLAERYDAGVATIVSAFFLLGYVSVLLPVVLYTGSLALIGIFELEVPLWMVSAGIAILGGAYAVFGGLKSVAVSDTLNGIGLLVGGLAVPALGLAMLGDGSVLAGISALVERAPQSLRVVGRPQDSLPWPTLLSGMMLIQLFYWSTNQVIVQRAMAARSLADGQKGVLFAAGLKLLGPLMLCLPALIALRMPELEIRANDQAYPALVRAVLPQWSLGLFAAVLVGSILSSFNSALNSAATLYCLEFHRGRWFPKTSDEDLVRVGKYFGIIVGALAAAGAPALAAADSIFEYLQQVNGLYSVPIISIFLMGIVTRRADGRGARAGILVGLASYSWFTFAGVEGLHWLHGYAISFVAASLATLALSAGSQGQVVDATAAAPEPRLEGWGSAKLAGGLCVAAAAVIYLVLSVVAGPR